MVRNAILDKEGQGEGCATSPPAPAWHPFPSRVGSAVTTRDIRSLSRAVRKGWDLPDELRALLPQLAMAFAQGLKVDPITKTPLRVSERGQLAAMRLLFAMVMHNDCLPPQESTTDSDDEELDYSQLSIEELEILEKAFSRCDSSRRNGDCHG